MISFSINYRDAGVKEVMRKIFVQGFACGCRYTGKAMMNKDILRTTAEELGKVASNEFESWYTDSMGKVEDVGSTN